MSRANLITCGMYAFNQALQQAWRELFEQFENPLGDRIELNFEQLDSTPRERLLFGHTCGYPYLKFFAEDYAPLCVPVFDLPGAHGKFYSSRIIVPANSGIGSLADCRDKVVAINGYDSNSGMNLLRYELARAGAGPGFFRRVMVSGGHRASLKAVAAGEAQLAAIDCVSFQLIADDSPELLAGVECIGFTAQCCGLPFVIAREIDTPELRASLLGNFDRALCRASPTALARLHLQAFEAVDETDYRSIAELENYAISKGYGTLN